MHAINSTYFKVLTFLLYLDSSIILYDVEKLHITLRIVIIAKSIRMIYQIANILNESFWQRGK